MPTKKPTVQYSILTVLLIWAAVAQLTASGFLIYLQVVSQDRTTPPFNIREYTRSVERVSPSYSSTGIKPGDEILDVDGRPVTGLEPIQKALLDARPGDVLRVTVLRSLPNGQKQTLQVPIRLHQVTSTAFGWTITIGLNVVLPLSCLLLGFFVAFMRPLDPLAWITMAMLASFGQVVGIWSLWAVWSPWRELLLVYHGLLTNTWPIWMLLFGLYFPAPFGILQKHKWLSWVLALPFIFLTAVELYGDLEQGNHVGRLHWMAAMNQQGNVGLNVLFAVYVFGFFGALIVKRYQTGTEDAIRRLRYMITGCSLALIPLLVLVIAQLTSMAQLPLWVISICLLMLLFFPATMAYVIVVQRAMDIRMVVRSGVRYAMASTSIQILRISLAAALVGVVAFLVQHSARTWQTAVIIGVGISLMGALGWAGRSFTGWMDRRFFREAYNSEVILTELSNSVAGFHDTKKLLETVTHRISQSLHVPRVAVLLEQGDRYKTAYTLGVDGGATGVELRREALTVRLLKQSQSPSRVYFDDPQSWVHGAPEQEQELLQKLEAQLLLPVSMNSRMLGVISLGPKRSEVPYSGTDLRLLSAVASQTGLALENARLTESIKQEVAQRERINRELEIAREVQERLFPQQLPQVQGLEVAGYCRPALGVGGDYYDFLRLQDGCIGMAVGDVAGKGIGAALMMASLQASLRGQTIRPCSSLSEMIQLINRLVYEASSESSYATFFYAQYETSTRILHYVNAGHNAPIVYRNKAVPPILRLHTGGTVIGLLPDCVYQEDQVTLEPGDVLLAYTDGISEAMNHAEEEWEEMRLMQAVAECHCRSAADIIKYVLDRVDAFTAGARQHDDMTLAVMRVQ
ncbi:MAG TPA: SpoIIE family protein phosphatase [Bryobacteraceae bacterium]|nr:SpoIIE family protein phosphatase [Bryobacteraceae bacterium]